jgi:hypothetical protein
MRWELVQRYERWPFKVGLLALLLPLTLLLLAALYVIQILVGFALGGP